MEMMKTFGGSATPVDWGELYTALQSNVVDGAENNTPSVTTAFHHEVVKYYSVNEHTMCPDVIIISLATWQKLTEQERNWLRQAADAAAIYQRKLWAEQEKQSLEEMEAHGVETVSYTHLESLGNGVEVVFAKGSNLVDDSVYEANFTDQNRSTRDDRSDEQLIAEALKVAEGADVIIAALGESRDMSGEGASRAILEMPQKRCIRDSRKTW